MYLLHSKRIFVFSLLLSLFLFPAGEKVWSQDSRNVLLHVGDWNAEVTNEELKDITFRVENTGMSSFSGTVSFYSGRGTKVVSRQAIPVYLEAGKSLFVSAKIYIQATTPAGDIPFSVKLNSEDNKTIDSVNTVLLLNPSRMMKALVMTPDLIMPAVGEKLRVPVLVSNRGNVIQEANIVIAYPAVLQDEANKSVKIAVPAFSDTIIYFERKINKLMYKLEYMDITIYGVYTNGDYFSIAAATVQTLKSKKKFGSGNQRAQSFTSGNYVSFRTQNTFSNNESYALQSRGDYAIEAGNVAYSLNVFKWRNASLPLLVNDTWLGLEYKGWGIKAGNIMQMGELSYNGRGIEVYYYPDSARRSKIYTGYIDKSYNLLDNAGSYSFGSAAWVGFSQQRNKLSSNTMVSYDEDRYTRAKSMIVLNNATWRLTDLLFVGGKIGVANSTSAYDNDRNRPSLSIGGSLNGNINKNISVSSDNLYSTAYYPGTRRGTISFVERINIRLGQNMVSGGFMYNNIRPKFFTPGIIYFQNDNAATTAELSIARSYGPVNISIAPQYYREKGNWMYGTGVLEGLMTAYRVSTSISLSNTGSNQTLLFRFDAGQYTTSFDPGYSWQLRGNFSYSYRFFRLNAHLQKGNFFLSESFQQYTSDLARLRVNISPSVQGSFFDNKLKANAGVSYYNDYYISGLMFNAGLNYDLPATRLFAILQYNTFNAASSYRNIQLGITQMLPQSRREAIRNKGTIEIFVYYDLNSNGIFDANDSIAKDYMALIDKVLLTTDKAGRIVYSRLPSGNYKIYFPTQKGWYGPDQFVVVGDKEHINLNIPLRQTGTVRGRIAFEYDEVLSYQTERELAGHVVVATNDEGGIFETRTFDNGQYTLYLPTGSYTITIKNLPAQIEVVPTNNNAQPLDVVSGKIMSNVDFTLKVKQRKINIKKFGNRD